MRRVRQVLREVVSASVRREFPGSLGGIHRMLGDLEFGGHDPTVRPRTALRERPDLLMLHRFGSFQAGISVARAALPPMSWQAT
jgi:hypothetical protein